MRSGGRYPQNELISKPEPFPKKPVNCDLLPVCLLALIDCRINTELWFTSNLSIQRNHRLDGTLRFFGLVASDVQSGKPIWGVSNSDINFKQ